MELDQCTVTAAPANSWSLPGGVPPVAMVLTPAYVGGSATPQPPAKLSMSHCCFTVEQPGGATVDSSALFYTAQAAASGQMGARECVFQGASVQAVSSEPLRLTDCTIRLHPHPGAFMPKHGYCLCTSYHLMGA